MYLLIDIEIDTCLVAANRFINSTSTFSVELFRSFNKKTPAGKAYLHTKS